jgi:hypothetical protein
MQKSAFLEKLKANYGILSVSASQVGLSSRTIERWRKDDPDFNEACVEEMKVQRGLVEGKLLEKITEGDTIAIRFYLRCKGRSASMVPETWVESVMVQGNPDAPLHVHATVDHHDARAEMGDTALAKALASAIKVNPKAFASLTAAKAATAAKSNPS